MQRSFIFGEISIDLQGASDMQRYQAALAECKNFVISRSGGARNRTGSQFLDEEKDSSARGWFLKFVFSDDQTYVIEAGDHYIRFYRNGARIVVDSPSAWADATPYLQGNVVSDSGTNYYCLQDHTSDMSNDEPGSGTNQADFWYALTGDIFEIPSPWAIADIQYLQYGQSADVLTLTHRGYPPYELKRYSDRWTLTPVEFVETLAHHPSIGVPLNGSGSAGSGGGLTFLYRVTAVKRDSYEESLPGLETWHDIEALTQADPVVLTLTAHGFLDGDEVFIAGQNADHMKELNGRRFIVANKNTDDFELNDADGNGIDGTAYTAYTGYPGDPMLVARTSIKIESAAAPVPATPNVIEWDQVEGAVEYRIYRDDGNGIFGFIGIAARKAVSGRTQFSDTGFEPDLTITPPVERSIFNSSDNYPTAFGYYQQRAVYADTLAERDKVWCSRTGFLRNFTTRQPIQDDDAVTFRPLSRKVSEIRHLIEVGRLLVLTSTGVFAIVGGQDGVLTPTGVNPRNVAGWGSSWVMPELAGDALLYVQARGARVRELKYSNEQGYAGADLNEFATHLLKGMTIERMAWAEEPDGILWCVRSDGALLGLTYLGNGIFGWHVHTTDGAYEDVVSVPETTPPPPGSTERGKEEDAVYVMVRRTIDGSTKRYVERFATRRFEDYRLDGYFLDSFLTYNGIATAGTMTLTSGAGWTTADTITVTASISTFSADDVGKAITVWIGGGAVARIVVAAYSSGTVVTGNPIATVDPTLRSTPLTGWSRAVNTVDGLEHLEGKDVSILANGVVLSGTVSSGEVSLGDFYDVVHVGLPYASDLETLDLEDQAGTIRDEVKLVNNASLLVERTRGGVKAGPDADHLLPYLTEAGEALGFDIFSETGGETTNGLIELSIDCKWEKPGRIHVQQTDPLPIGILAVIPRGFVPGGGK